MKMLLEFFKCFQLDLSQLASCRCCRRLILVHRFRTVSGRHDEMRWNPDELQRHVMMKAVGVDQVGRQGFGPTASLHMCGLAGEGAKS